jgi:hypothetical protein
MPDDNGVSSGYQIDFQAQALIGAVHRGYNASATNQLEMYPYVFSGEMSDWSSTQTITLPSTSTLPTSTPTVPELPILVLVPLLLSVFSVVVVFRHRKTAKANQQPFPTLGCTRPLLFGQETLTKRTGFSPETFTKTLLSSKKQFYSQTGSR